MGINLNFAGVETNEFEPIPIGTYNASVFDIEVKEGKQSGKPYLNWQFSIQDDGYKNRRVFMMTSLAPNALWKLKGTIIALLGGEVQDDYNFNPKDFLGLPCRVRVTVDEYEGKERNKVDSVYASAQLELANEGEPIAVDTKMKQNSSGLFGKKKK